MKKLLMLLSVAAALSVGVALPASAAIEGGHAWGVQGRASDAEIDAIMAQAFATGTVTKAQRAKVLSRPDIAANTIDPTSARADYQELGFVPDGDQVYTEPRSDLTVPTPTADATNLAAGVSTARKDRYIVYDSWTGTVQLRYHFVVAWNYNGSTVTAKPTAYTYITDCLGTCTDYGIQRNSTYANYSNGRLYAYTVPLLGKHRYCKAGSCMDWSPDVRFGAYYNGTYSYVFNNK